LTGRAETEHIKMSFNQVLLILRARWRIAFGIFGTVTLIALAHGLVSPKQYTATASVVIDMKTDPLAAAGSTDQLLASYIGTQADIIASVRVAQRAVKAVKLDQIRQFQDAWRSKTHGKGDIDVWLAESLLARNVVVGPASQNKVGQGNVISISVMWPDPQLAAALANAFAQAAIETNLELKIEPAKQYARWFDERSRMLRADLEAKQKRLSDFQTASGIVATDEKLDLENARLAELSTQLVVIQGLRQDSQSRQRQTSGDNQSLPEVLQSPVIAKLKDDLSEAEAKKADIAGRLGKNHPDYQAATAEVLNLRARIAEESAKIASSLGSNTQVNVRRENDVRLALEQQKKRVLELKHEHDEAAVLQNDVTTAQRDLDAVSQRYAQSSLESQAQLTNMVLLTTATEPFAPSGPKLLLHLLAGLFLGSILGGATALLLELKDPRLRSGVELLQLTGIPLLVTIGPMKIRGPSGASAGGPPQRLEPAAV
jgi:chain length determinant protein EpsF